MTRVDYLPLNHSEHKLEAVSEFKKGLIIALSILGIWFASLSILLTADVTQWHFLPISLAILWQTFLYTGLFITAHDAMHGVVYPGNPKINNLIGTIALGLYALFSYKELLQKHQLHHRFPASDRDPDFHNGNHKNFLAWYLYFMFRYWSWTRLAGLISIYYLVQYFLNISSTNLTFFWIIPSILSSAQLFYFGTYLPHQEPKEGYQNHHRARTISRSIFWSFISCYHFGYHHEHHEFPHMPWWKLPEVHQRGVNELKHIGTV